MESDSTSFASRVATFLRSASSTSNSSDRPADKDLSRGTSTPPLGPPVPTTTPLLYPGETSEVLSADVIEEVDCLFPESFQGYQWKLLYSIARDGANFGTFYRKVKGKTPTILAIKTMDNEVFGAFTTTAWRVSKEYYGTGQSFLYKVKPWKNANGEDELDKPKIIQFFPWTHNNTYYMVSDEDYLAFGGGGEFGLFIGEDFFKGSSGACETFFNCPLAKSRAFEVAKFECWTLQQAEVAKRRNSIPDPRIGGLVSRNSRDEMSIGLSGRDVSATRIVEYDASELVIPDSPGANAIAWGIPSQALRESLGGRVPIVSSPLPLKNLSYSSCTTIKLGICLSGRPVAAAAAAAPPPPPRQDEVQLVRPPLPVPPASSSSLPPCTPTPPSFQNPTTAGSNFPVPPKTTRGKKAFDDFDSPLPSSTCDSGEEGDRPPQQPQPCSLSTTTPLPPASNSVQQLSSSSPWSQGVAELSPITPGRRRPPPLGLAWAAPTVARHNLSLILDYLMVGGDAVSSNVVVLREMNIKSVVNCTSDGPEELPCDDLEYVRLGWKDDVHQVITVQDLERAFTCIENARMRGGISLVHCKSGMSRSGAVVLAYLMERKDMTLLEALTFARSKRAIISPNSGFMSQLLDYEMQLKGRVTIDVTKYEENRFDETSLLAFAA